MKNISGEGFRGPIKTLKRIKIGWNLKFGHHLLGQKHIFDIKLNNACKTQRRNGALYIWSFRDSGNGMKILRQFFFKLQDALQGRRVFISGYILLYLDICLYILIYFYISWYISVYLDIFLNILIYLYISLYISL